jgi:hypothetical protein
VGDLESHLLGKVEAQKLIFMAPQAVIDVVRPGIEASLAGRASCTTALSGMLEVGRTCFLCRQVCRLERRVRSGKRLGFKAALAGCASCTTALSGMLEVRGL